MSYAPPYSCESCQFGKHLQISEGWFRKTVRDTIVCEIRDFNSIAPGENYCSNHPGTNPQGQNVAIGPVYVKGEDILASDHYADDDDTRAQLLDMIGELPEYPDKDSSAQSTLHCEAIHHLAAIGERRAEASLMRILGFDPSLTAPDDSENRVNSALVAAALEALATLAPNSARYLIEPWAEADKVAAACGNTATDGDKAKVSELLNRRAEQLLEQLPPAPESVRSDVMTPDEESAVCEREASGHAQPQGS